MLKKSTVILASGLSLAVLAPAARGDDLADLKAAHAQTMKALTTGDVDLWLASLHDEQVRFDYARTGGKWLRVLTHISALPPAD